MQAQSGMFWQGQTRIFFQNLGCDFPRSGKNLSISGKVGFFGQTCPEKYRPQVAWHVPRTINPTSDGARTISSLPALGGSTRRYGMYQHEEGAAAESDAITSLMELLPEKVQSDFARHLKTLATTDNMTDPSTMRRALLSLVVANPIAMKELQAAGMIGVCLGIPDSEIARWGGVRFAVGTYGKVRKGPDGVITADVTARTVVCVVRTEQPHQEVYQEAVTAAVDFVRVGRAALPVLRTSRLIRRSEFVVATMIELLAVTYGFEITLARARAASRPD